MSEIKPNNTQIFEYLKPSDNTKLAEFYNDDLEVLLSLINQYYLEFRQSLGFDEKVTYGFELEFENPQLENIKNGLIKNFLDYRWYIKKDKSLDAGAEIATPILFDRKKDWDEFCLVCDILKNNSIIKQTCSGHIHIGTQVLGDSNSAWQNFLLLWAVYENIIFRFTAGEYINPRPFVTTYAASVLTNFIDVFFTYNWEKKLNLPNLRRALGYQGYSFDHYQAINLSYAANHQFDYEEHNTIEFRTPNGTLEPIIWQNNLNLFLALIRYAKSTKFDEDTILRRYQTIGNNMYNRIYLEQAIELADLIFVSNVDKVYFLRQYLKGFQETEHCGEFAKVRTFIKTKR